MSQENIDVIRRAFESWPRGDFDPEQFWTQNVEWHHDPDDPDARITRGRTEVYEVLTQRQGLLGAPRVEIESIEEVGDEAFVCARLYPQGGQGGTPLYLLGRVVDGKVARVRAFWHHDQALQAAGLRQ